MTHAEFHRRSIDDPQGFWGEQAALIDWQTPPAQILDYSNPPFRKWFVGGTTNLCHNAVDRHLAARADQAAIQYLSSETGEARSYTYAELHREVNRCAAVLRHLGVKKGERVVIYMPMVAEAVFCMLACARLGAVHSVVFGGFAAHNLALRIDDAKPCLLICADAGMRGGKPVPYKHLVDAAIKEAKFPPPKVLIVDRGLDADMRLVPGRDEDYWDLRDDFRDAEVPVTWLEANEPSYILYTSGTTGKPKGVQRDVGGYAVALAASMKYIYGAGDGKGAGEAMFTTSDIGWVVGHSYIVYGPLIHGMTTIVYEGLPIKPDAGIWWRIVQEHKVTTMFSSPTAIRVLKKQDPEWLKKYDISSLRYLFIAGEPLDEPTSRWISDGLGVPVIDHYWQTETGWAMLTLLPGIEMKPVRFGSPGFPAYGFNIRVVNELTGADCGPNEKGVLAVVPPLPPGCLTTVWGDDDRFVNSYFGQFKDLLYSSSDWALRDADGYFFILGRTDDVINTAGHRLGTREIEEALQAHPGIAEVAVVGVADELKGQVPIGFCTVKDVSRIADAAGREQMAQECIAKVAELLGAVAKPHRLYFVNSLPKTRSGKLLRRSIQALAEGRETGDLSTLDDPNSLEEIRKAVGR
ncbi:MAG: propionate--CoA ligase [Betaproteobacteria bacterium]|nr:propionate--CoA ligase [Betaproteobacteria bacterium]